MKWKNTETKLVASNEYAILFEKTTTPFDMHTFNMRAAEIPQSFDNLEINFVN